MKKCLLVLVFILLLAGCQKKTTNDSRLTTNENIIVTSPEVAEIICELGLIDRISGVTLECDYPEELQNKTIVGTFGKVDMEKVIALDPTLVFVSGLEQEFIATELAKMEIKVETIYPNTVMEMLDSIMRIGEIMGVPERSKALTKALRAEIESLQAAVSEKRPSIYVEIYGNPLMSVSDSSYVGELVELAGFDNIFSELPRVYSRISPEAVLDADPEYILLLYPGINAEDVKERKGWQNLAAVRNNRVFGEEVINADLLLRATPRSIIELAGLINLRTDE